MTGLSRLPANLGNRPRIVPLRREDCAAKNIVSQHRPPNPLQRELADRLYVDCFIDGQSPAPIKKITKPPQLTFALETPPISSTRRREAAVCGLARCRVAVQRLFSSAWAK
jgi:hypothetical protein